MLASRMIFDLDQSLSSLHLYRCRRDATANSLRETVIGFVPLAIA